MYLLGYDIGSSSVKAALVETETGRVAASAFYPKTEMTISAPRTGWAEQEPALWWENLKLATADVLCRAGAKGDEVEAIGISYQMHGLVVLGCDGARTGGCHSRHQWCGVCCLTAGKCQV